MQLDQQYWKSKEVYPWTFGRTQSEEINNSAQHFAEWFKEVLLQNTNKTKHQGSRQQERITFCNLISDQIEQKRFVKGNYQRKASVSNMLQELNWPSLQDRRTAARLTMLYKINSGDLPLSIPEKFISVGDIPDRAETLSQRPNQHINHVARNMTHKYSSYGSVHKYLGGGGLGKMEGGGPKKFWVAERGGPKSFQQWMGGVKKVWSNWKYNEN